MFPAVDPIPLPAPVWLFKLLDVVTLTLHFLALGLLMGGLVMSAVWALLGRAWQSDVMVDSSGAVATRLPVVMTYVINLGVPPLLFAQVLYGRAIYTSSVLIGVYWIAVVFLLMLAYTLLYVMVSRSGSRLCGWLGLAALLVVAKIALIYSSNMTLMLRPDLWQPMYRADALGLHLNQGDPTVVPRWLFMLCGGLLVGGVGMMWLGMSSQLAPATAQYLRLWGPRLAVVGVLARAATGFWVVSAQPAGIWDQVRGSALHVGCLVLWAGAAVVLIVVSLLAQAAARSRHWLWPATAGILVSLQVAAVVLLREAIRDVSLAQHGLNIWDRHVTSNWVVVGIFLVTFVLGLAALAWLGTVMARARPVEERYV